MESRYIDRPSLSAAICEARARGGRDADKVSARPQRMRRVLDIAKVEEVPGEVAEIENVWIELPDGCRLAARLWLPRDARKKPVPALLEYLPYRKRDLTRSRDERIPPYFAGQGYACVRVDVRGSGDSDGLLVDEYIARELEEALAGLAWIAGQPWCDGGIGMFGKSWG